MFFILFYSVLHHLFCIKTCYSVILDVTQKWPTAWLFENVLESDGKMNLRYDTLATSVKAGNRKSGGIIHCFFLVKSCQLKCVVLILKPNFDVFLSCGSYQ